MIQLFSEQYSLILWVVQAVGIAAALQWFLEKRREWSRRCRLLKELPHPEPKNRWLYHLKEILECPKVPGRNILNAWSLLAKYGELYKDQGMFSIVAFSPYRLPFMARPVVMLLDYDLTKAAVSHPALQSKGTTYETNEPVIKDSVLVAVGHDWKRMRKLTSKAFSTEVMNNVHHSSGNLLKEKIYPILDTDEKVDVVDITARFALDVLGLVAFSYDLGGLDELRVQSETLKANNGAQKKMILYKVFEEIMEDMIVFNRSCGLYKFIPLCPRFRPNMQYLNSTINCVVEKRLSDDKGYDDLLHHLFDKNDAGEPILSREEILGNTRTFMFAGHDTTSSTLTFIIYELSRHPKVVEKLRVELDPLFSGGDSPTYSVLRKCCYLDAVVRETLRLHPPALYSRMSKTEDVILKTDKFEYKIPKKTEIIAAPWLVQRNETGHEFNPDRVVEKDDSYFPFAIGTRNCVGREMAQAEVRAVVAHLVRDYDLIEPDEEVVTFSRITLNPNQCEMKFKRRAVF